jgi:thiol-disulfide isomerase/thioredoxin
MSVIPCSRHDAAMSASLKNDGFSSNGRHPSLAAITDTTRPLPVAHGERLWQARFLTLWRHVKDPEDLVSNPGGGRRMQPSANSQAALIALMCLGLPAFASAQRGIPHVAPWEWDAVDFPPSNPSQDIAKALVDAAKDGKHVLLDFGADWCVDCKILERIFRDPTVATFLDDHFHLVRIDLGMYSEADKVKNAETAAQYGVGTIQVGIPALVLLDSHGGVVQPKDSVRWSTARYFTAPEVLDYLKQLAEAR